MSDRGRGNGLILHLATLVVVAGVALRAVQWLGNPSLWLDELQLVANLRQLSAWELATRGLGYGQVAPIGYLLSARLAIGLFGDGELVLRVVPALAAVLALILFWRLSTRLLGAHGALVATAAFSFNPMLISLAGVAKQYATDVLGAVLILWAVLLLWRVEAPVKVRVAVATGAGFVAFLSIPSIVVAAPAMAALVLRTWQVAGAQGAREFGRLMVPLVIWFVLALGGALWARQLVTPEMAAYMTAYWHDAGAFAPAFSEFPTWTLLRWSGEMLPGLLLQPYIGAGGAFDALLSPRLNSYTGWAALTAVLVLATAGVARAAGPLWAACVLLPLPLSLVLARIAVYPLDVRTSVYLVPSILLLAGAAAALWSQMLVRSGPALRHGVPVLLVLVFAAVAAEYPPIYTVQRDRDLFEELVQRRAPGEPIFAHHWARGAFSYYGERFAIDGPVLFGGHDTEHPGDLGRLEAFAGTSTLWVLFTRSPNRDLVLCYLDEIGVEREVVVLPAGMRHDPVSLHRYDLSSGIRASNSWTPLTAEAFEGVEPRCRRRDWRAPARKPFAPRTLPFALLHADASSGSTSRRHPAPSNVALRQQ
jgi:4-amino-4-deoxy-L-arabinose transferase-like glycosyltransferase